MNPRDFHKLAVELAGSEDAAELRTAVSRAYYATYNVGVEILETLGFRIPHSAAGHGDVRRRLNYSGDIEISEISTKLASLYSRRLEADYDLSKKGTEAKKTVQALVRSAKEMMDGLEKCCIEPKKSKIIQSIKENEQKIAPPNPSK